MLRIASRPTRTARVRTLSLSLATALLLPGVAPALGRQWSEAAAATLTPGRSQSIFGGSVFGRVVETGLNLPGPITVGGEEFGGGDGGEDKPPVKGDDDCAYLADYVDYLAKKDGTNPTFIMKLRERFEVPEPRDLTRYGEFGARGFKDDFVENPAHGTSSNQVNHYAGVISRAYGVSFYAYYSGQPFALAYGAALAGANTRERGSAQADGPDRRMNVISVAHGVKLRYGLISQADIGKLIRSELCK